MARAARGKARKICIIDLRGPGVNVNEEIAFLALSVRFKGQRKGGVTENASYYIFTQCADGAFEAFPVNSWYNFIPLSKHRTLTAEEAEEEWSRSGRGRGHTLAVTCCTSSNCPPFTGGTKW